MKEESKHKSYVGDGVYLDIDTFECLVVTTENGMCVTNTIIFEPETYQAFIEAVDRLRATGAIGWLGVPDKEV